MALPHFWAGSAPAAALALACSLQVLAGCSSGGGGTAGVTHPTMIEVAPQDFLGNLTCTTQGQGVRRYVATLFDVTVGSGAPGEQPADIPTEGGFRLPSSPPTPCSASVGFGFVAPGRRYRVEVDAYDTTQLEARVPGSRRMVDVSSGSSAAGQPAIVEPTWSTQCAGATAVQSTIVRAGGCAPLEPQPTGPAELSVDTGSLLGDLQCGDGAGQIERLEVTLQDETPQTVSVACGEVALFSGLAGRRSLTLLVKAFAADGAEAFAGAKCQGLIAPGASVTATCADLSQVGSLRVDLPRLLSDLGLACGAQISDVRVKVPGVEQERSFPPPDCLQPFDQGFAAGAAAVTVTVLKDSTELAILTCGGNVVPGDLVVAECRAP